jgi:hypothetical protein
MKPFVLFLALPLLAAGPTTWELTQYADFLAGKLRHVSLTRDGELRPGLATARVDTLPETSLWSMAVTPEGTVFLGSGPNGRLYRQRPADPAPVLYATLAEPHIFALAAAPNGAVYAAASPGGKVYRLDASGPTLFAQTPANLIWSLLATNDAVFAGGDEGRLFRLTAGAAMLYYQSNQSNITALAAGPNGSLYAGSDPNGLLFHITAPNQARVLYDAPFTEIRTILPHPSGIVHFLAMGGVASRRQPAATQPTVAPSSSGAPQVTTTITVTEAAQGGLNIKPPAPAAATLQTPAATTPTTTYDIPGLDRSAIYRLNANLTVDQLYVTKEETLFDLALHQNQLHFVTDRAGRLYRLDGDRIATLLAETGEGELGRLVSTPTGWLTTATAGPKLIRLSSTPAGPYEYESPVHEAPNLATWGALRLMATGSPKLETRSGNTSRPDDTWSAWAPLNNGISQSPAARYIQWRLQAAAPFTVRAATLHYLPRNQPPVVKSITAVLTVSAAPAAATPAASSTTSTYTLTVTDTGEASSSSSAGTPSQTPANPARRQLTLSWTAEDPDGDLLRYNLEFRPESGASFLPLKQDIAETHHVLDAETLADGRYLFRVTASDLPANSPATAQTAQLVSVPVLLDQTAPRIEASLSGNQLRVTAIDAASPIRRIEVSVNAGPWQILDADDGIFDSLTESASATLTLPAGESVVTVRASDTALNTGLQGLLASSYRP